jgi:predicted acylesterase/phospholipase RssA
LSEESAVLDPDELTSADYSAPERSCDIVMKGGITSGVVYPHAVCELAQTYRFRNVGGTSAGAIAAAATAAAEYGRAEKGFNKLAQLPEWLGTGTNLRNLFQPQRKTRKLYAVLLAGVDRGPRGAIATAVGEHLPATLLGVLPGLALAAAALAGMETVDSTPLRIAGVIAFAFLALLFAVLGASLAVAGRIVWEASRRVPANGFGICRGETSDRAWNVKPLTPWLADLLNDLAHLPRDTPLTFGHLWAGPEKSRKQAPTNPGERYLQLAMMTTNLTNRRAHQLPWESREWFFDPSEFRDLFPEEVVRWMEEHPPPPPANYNARKVRESRMRQALMRPLLPLPAPADLPVIVATRMSLSFPVLLSALPLWNLDMTREKNRCLDDWKRWACNQPSSWDPLEQDEGDWPEEGRPEGRPVAERCWFSDGGISSNFPVHFFDRLVPRWPTFAINLRPFHPDRQPEGNNAWMVKANKDGIAEWWYPFSEKGGLFDKRLVEFLSSVMKTMQNRVDEAQMRVPGFRDRVSHVSLTGEEGGMNLTMPPERIAALTTRGRFAARLLRNAYTRSDSSDEPITWDNHRWVRLRSSLAVLEEMHRGFADGYCKDPERLAEGERTYAELVERKRDDLPKSYRWVNDRQRQLATKEIAAIQAAANAPKKDESVGKEGPDPAPEGRITPRP